MTTTAELTHLLGKEGLLVTGEGKQRLTFWVRIVDVKMAYGRPLAQVVPVAGQPDPAWVELHRVRFG